MKQELKDESIKMRQQQWAASTHALLEQPACVGPEDQFVVSDKKERCTCGGQQHFGLQSSIDSTTLCTVMKMVLES